MRSKKVTLFYDIISPYSWAGFEYATRYAAHSWKHTSLEMQPMFLGGIMAGSKNKPPGVVPAKMKFMMRDLEYKKQYDGIPFTQIANPAEKLFKKGAMSAQRYLTAMKLDNQPLEDVSRQFSVKMWCTDEDVTSADVLKDAALKAGQSDAQFDQYWAAKGAPDTKQELGTQTEIALKHGAFGAPFFHCRERDGETHDFWLGQN